MKKVVLISLLAFFIARNCQAQISICNCIEAITYKFSEGERIDSSINSLFILFDFAFKKVKNDSIILGDRKSITIKKGDGFDINGSRFIFERKFILTQQSGGISFTEEYPSQIGPCICQSKEPSRLAEQISQLLKSIIAGYIISNEEKNKIVKSEI